MPDMTPAPRRRPLWRLSGLVSRGRVLRMAGTADYGQ